MLHDYLDWVERQFRHIHLDEQARDLIAWLQGALLFAAGFRSPEMLTHRLQRIEQWIYSFV